MSLDSLDHIECGLGARIRVLCVGAPNIHASRVLGHAFFCAYDMLSWTIPPSAKLLRGQRLLPYSINSVFLSLLLFWSFALLLRLEDSETSLGVSDTPEWMNGCFPLRRHVWSPVILQYLTAERRSVETRRSRESFVLGGVTKPRMQTSCARPPAQPISALETHFELHPFTHPASIH